MSGDDPGATPWLGVAVAVACCGAFVVGISEPLADSLDRMVPTRELVAKHGSSAEHWSIEVDGSGNDSAAVREALLSVPKAFTRRIAEFDGRIIFIHSGALADIRNLDEHDLLRAAGVYHPASRTAYVSTDGEGAGGTGLHEIGHMLDHALGDLSSQPEFLEIYELVLGNGLLQPYARSNPRECFADIFERYYFSDRRRQGLASQLPEGLEYMKNLEQAAMR